MNTICWFQESCCKYLCQHTCTHVCVDPSSFVYFKLYISKKILKSLELQICINWHWSKFCEFDNFFLIMSSAVSVLLVICEKYFGIVLFQEHFSQDLNLDVHIAEHACICVHTCVQIYHFKNDRTQSWELCKQAFSCFISRSTHEILFMLN